MPATTILLIDKTGSIKELAVKEYKEEDLYKKAGFKSAEHFLCQTTWSPITLSTTAKTYHISVYGKKTGKAGQENKYDFPPPIDTTLFFGTCVLVNKDAPDGNAINLTSSEWTAIYEHLFGGFEDIGAADSEEEASTDENDEYSTLEKTTSGYAKDNFVVSDNESDDDYTEAGETSSASSDEKKKKKKPVAKKPAAKKAATKKTTPITTTTQPIPTNIFVQTVQSTTQYLDCTSELTEEEYV